MDEKKPLILITGICGRIGSAVAEMFSKHYHVVGLDICTPEKLPENVELIFTDLSSIENVRDSLAQAKKKYGDHIASCIHLAAYYNFTGGSWEKYEKITVRGTENLLVGLRDFQVDQIIFSSTLLVHSPCKLGEKLSETSPVDPKWEYPLSKIQTEKLIKEKRGNASCVILRIAGIYDDECNSIPISQHLKRIYEEKPESHLFPGNIHHGATFLHMDDLVHALKILVEKRGQFPPEEILLLGEEEVMSYAQLQHEMGRLIHGKPHWTIRIPKWVAKLGAYLKDKLPFFKKTFIKPWMVDLADDHYDIDISKAKEILGWQPAHTLKNCLPKMVEQLKKNPKKWIQKHDSFA